MVPATIEKTIEETIESTLDSFAEAGRKAWSDVADASAWVEDLRGAAAPTSTQTKLQPNLPAHLQPEPTAYQKNLDRWRGVDAKAFLEEKRKLFADLEARKANEEAETAQSAAQPEVEQPQKIEDDDDSWQTASVFDGIPDEFPFYLLEQLALRVGVIAENIVEMVRRFYPHSGTEGLGRWLVDVAHREWLTSHSNPADRRAINVQNWRVDMDRFLQRTAPLLITPTSKFPWKEPGFWKPTIHALYPTRNLSKINRWEDLNPLQMDAVKKRWMETHGKTK